MVERFQQVISQLFQQARRNPASKPADGHLLCDGRLSLAVSVQRIVRLGGAVDDDMANLIVAQLLYLDSVDKKRDITMYVNSPGGSVTAGNGPMLLLSLLHSQIYCCTLLQSDA